MTIIIIIVIVIIICPQLLGLPLSTLKKVRIVDDFVLYSVVLCGIQLFKQSPALIAINVDLFLRARHHKSPKYLSCEFLSLSQ